MVSKFKNKKKFSEVGMKNKLQKHDQRRETLRNKNKHDFQENSRCLPLFFCSSVT